MTESPFSITIGGQTAARKTYNTRKLTLTALLFGVVGLTIYFAATGPGMSAAKTELFAAQDDEVMRAYVNFIAEYGRSYSTKKQHGEKYEVFKRNYEAIKEHNKHEKVLPYAMAVNQFADLTPEEFTRMSRAGLEMPKVLMNETINKVLEPPKHVHGKNHAKHHKGVEVTSQSPIPEAINWYTKGFVSEPKDQMACGSCWAFTTAATLETLAMQSGQFSKPPSFSMQQLLDCDKSNDGCDGGWMYKAYDYTAKNGIMLYEDYPYEMASSKSKCRYNKENAVFKNGGMVQEKNMPNEGLKALVAKHPVGVGIYTNNNFMFYKSGVLTEEFLQCSDPDQAVNHGVSVVGYGTTKDEPALKQWCDEYWVVRNSWGTKWGEGGFFKLCMDETGTELVPHGTCQINRYPTYPTVEAHEVEAELLK